MSMYMSDSHLPQILKIDSMLNEILVDMNVRVVSELNDGDQIGEKALLKDGMRTASVRCTEDTHLAYIKKSDF